MKNLVSRFVKDESGATAIEYGLIAAGIAIAIITAVKGVGSKLSETSTTSRPRSSKRSFEVALGASAMPGPLSFWPPLNIVRQRSGADAARPGSTLRFVESGPLGCHLLQRSGLE